MVELCETLGIDDDKIVTTVRLYTSRAIFPRIFDRCFRYQATANMEDDMAFQKNRKMVRKWYFYVESSSIHCSLSPVGDLAFIEYFLTCNCEYRLWIFDLVRSIQCWPTTTMTMKKRHWEAQ